ncbi:DUF551 domain-containing protein [Klebsiella aerogenes]|uniref:DUF551 domain-containing protein n=1 Tax=Klebsiella aerogenes TaxID=548 RepID=UPI003D6EE687
MDTNSELELAAFKMALAAMDSEPVAWIVHARTGDQLTTDGSYVANAEGILGLHSTPLYSHAQPAPVVPDDVSGPLAHAYKELTPTFMRNHIAVFERYGIAPNDSSTVIQALRIALDGIERRAAMLQAGTLTNEDTKQVEPVTTANKLGYSPVIPDGYVMVPKEPTEGMKDAYYKSSVAPISRLSICGYRAMLAAAPHDTPALNSVQSVVTVSDTWIPVSERMPEDEQEVLTINRMGHRFVSFFDKHSGLFFDRLDAPSACCIEHVLVTHWMELPAAPQEVK